MDENFRINPNAGCGCRYSCGCGCGQKISGHPSTYPTPIVEPIPASGLPKAKRRLYWPLQCFFLHQIKCKVPEKPIFRLVFYFALGWKKNFSANFTYIVSGNFKFSQADFQIFFRVAFCISREETKEIRVFFDSLTVKLSIFFSGWILLLFSR